MKITKACRFVLGLTVMFGLAMSGRLTSAAILEAPGTNFITMDKDKNSITVNLTNANLADVAETISKQAGIKVILEQSLDQSVSGKFDDMTIELGIKRLLGPISSSFVFVEEKDKAGKEIYRLESLKIFPKGKMFSSNTIEFVAGKPTVTQTAKADTMNIVATGVKAGTAQGANNMGVFATADTAGGGKAPQKTPGAMRHELIEARSNLDIMRRKSQAEVNHSNMKIADIQRELSQSPSPERRSELTQKLSHAEADLVRIKNLNSRIVIEEERNIREMAEQVIQATSRAKVSPH